jgi:hypothetical protein
MRYILTSDIAHAPVAIIVTCSLAIAAKLNGDSGLYERGGSVGRVLRSIALDRGGFSAE